MISTQQTSTNLNFYQFNKKTLFKSNKKYATFLNWLSGEFDLFLQEETNGLQIFFPEGNVRIGENYENGKIVAEINLKSKTKESGQLIFNKIMYVHQLFLKYNS